MMADIPVQASPALELAVGRIDISLEQRRIVCRLSSSQLLGQQFQAGLPFSVLKEIVGRVLQAEAQAENVARKRAGAPSLISPGG